MTIRVLKDFRDLKVHVNRVAGEEFSASAARASEIANKLPGYIEVLPDPDPAPKNDLRSMTKAELLAAAEERGLAVTPKMTKDKILELLEA